MQGSDQDVRSGQRAGPRAARPQRNKKKTFNVRDSSNDGPSDRQILAAMRSIEAKLGPVNCMRYRIECVIESDEAAESLAAEIIACELERIRVLSDTPVHIAECPVLASLSYPQPWKQGGRVLGLEMCCYFVGPTFTIETFGVHALIMTEADDAELPYQFQVMPLAQLRGRRLAAVWGEEGSSGTYSEREAKATKRLIRELQRIAGADLKMGGTSLPMLEIRNIKIGELDGKSVFGYIILGASDSILMRLNAASDDLRQESLELVTLDEYKERLLLAAQAGNQQLDAEEARTEGRKYMLWHIPRAMTAVELEATAVEFFGALYESSAVTMSAQLHPYAWMILTSTSHETMQAAADFEAVLQSKWGPDISVGLSKTRQQRIRMNDAAKARLEQKDGLEKPAGVLKEILIPKKLIQDAVMEGAFLDLWVDALYSRFGKRMVTDLSNSIEVKVKKMIDVQVEQIFETKMLAYSAKVLDKITKTIDSAVDFAIARCIEARQIRVEVETEFAEDDDMLYDDDDTSFVDLGAGLDIADLVTTRVADLEATHVIGSPGESHSPNPASPPAGMQVDAALTRDAMGKALPAVMRVLRDDAASKVAALEDSEPFTAQSPPKKAKGVAGTNDCAPAGNGK